MTSVTVPPSSILRHELQALHKQWWCFLLLGISLIVFGSVCIVDPLIGSIASVLFLGFVLLAGGITQIISSVWAGKWSGMLLHLLMGLLYVVVGYMIIDRPGVSMEVLTRFIAVFLIVGRPVPHCVVARDTVPRLGLGAVKRPRHADPGTYHQSPIARRGLVGHRPVRRHRTDLQRLGLGDVGIRTAAGRGLELEAHNRLAIAESLTDRAT